MSIFEDHRKRAVFSYISNKMEFSKVETMQYGDKMIFSFVCNKNTFMMTMYDHLWVIRSIVPAMLAEYGQHFDTESEQGIVVKIPKNMPVGIFNIIKDVIGNDIVQEVAEPILSVILANLKAGKINEDNLIKPEDAEEEYGQSMGILKSPTTGVATFVITQEYGSLILHYALTKTAKKSDVDYESIINTAAYGLVDLVTSDIEELEGVL